MSDDLRRLEQVTEMLRETTAAAKQTAEGVKIRMDAMVETLAAQGVELTEVRRTLFGWSGNNGLRSAVRGLERDLASVVRDLAEMRNDLHALDASLDEIRSRRDPPELADLAQQVTALRTASSTATSIYRWIIPMMLSVLMGAIGWWLGSLAGRP
jgi:hypothetical protein